MTDDSLIVVDLFAGAGGLSTGIAKACEDLGLEPGVDVELHAVNHDEDAIATHEANYPSAHHYHARIEELYPPDVVEPGEVKLLSGGPECTHFSNARGGKPVSDQKRASAWHVLDWIEKLRPDNVLLENVKEFRTWGPIDEDGEPTKDGSIFERWVGMLEALGYSVVYDDVDQEYGVVLNAADYGDPQSRERLFIMASRETLPTPPEPTHDDVDPEKPSRRPAANVIDWSDLGTSIWTRDLEHARVQPLASNTMARIAEGIRRHCSPRLAPFADALEAIGPDELEQLRETVVPAEHAATVAAAVEEPFLVRASGRTTLATPSVVKYYGTSSVTPTGAPLDTITADGNHHGLSTPAAFCLRQQSGGVPVVVDEPLSTVSTKGAIGMAAVESRSLVQPKNGLNGGLHSNALYLPEDQPFHTITSDPRAKLVTPYLCPMYNTFGDGERPRTRSLDRPLMTVTAQKPAPGCLATPFLVDYQGPPNSIREPLGTLTARDGFALCVPGAWPWGLDVRYRMLTPDELKQAQGFPEDYEITGSSKKTITAQIGNAVPVQLARTICRELLAGAMPSLSTYGAGLSPDLDVEVPDYQEVASTDD